MSIQSAFQLTFDFLGVPVLVEPSQGQLSSDAGLLPIRQFDEQIGLTAGFAAALEDRRDPAKVKQTILEMVRSRLYGIIASYQNDHDQLRHDPVFKLIANRRPDEPPLASQPTLSRFENQVTIADLWRLRAVMMKQFLDSFIVPPGRLTFDVDAVDDPAHGEQQLTLFHGYYDQNQYLPLLISNAETGQFVMLGLRPGNVHAALGADDDLEYLATAVRGRWPDVDIIVRGDCGFGIPKMYAVCERLQLTYTFGLGTNKVLERHTNDLLALAQQQYQQTRQPQRLFAVFSYRARTWSKPRTIIAKVECHAVGTNRRFVVSNRAGAALLPEGTYDEYVGRGEGENRNKEIKVGLAMDRLSDHRFLANFFRLYLHGAAHNLLTRLSRHVALPEPQPESEGEPAGTGMIAMALMALKAVEASVPSATEPVASGTGTAASAPAEPVPAEALVGKARREYFNRRRRYDPLGHAQPNTWRFLLIKVAAEVIGSTRRVVVRLAANWPYLHLFERVSQAVLTDDAADTAAESLPLPSPSG